MNMIFPISGLPRLAPVFLLIAGAAANPACAADAAIKEKPDLTRVSEIVERAVKERIFPGCSVAIGNRQRVLLAHGFGRLDYDGGAEVTPQTLYDLASVTKIVGATSVVLTLVRDGKLSVT